MSDLRIFFQNSSSFYGSNAGFIEDLYEQFLDNPGSIEPSWQAKFSELQTDGAYEIAHGPIVERFTELAEKSQNRLKKLQGFTAESVKKQAAVAR